MPLLTFPLTFTQNIAFPIKQTPTFNTNIQTPATKRGQLRISTTQFPIWLFDLDVSYLSGDATQPTSQWAQLINFYLAVQGAASDWLFLHPYDNAAGSYSVTGSVTSGLFFPNEALTQNTTGATSTLIGIVRGSNPMLISAVTGSPDNSHGWVGQKSGAVFTPTAVPAVNVKQAIGTGDGTTTAFSIVRSFTSGGAQDLIQNFVTPPAIYINTTLQSSGYTIDQYGTVTFSSAPGVGAVVSWIGQFYYRCHFLDDKWDNLEEDYYQIWSMDSLKFESVLL